MIEIHQVGKSFGRVRAVDGVTMTIRPGERVALVGSNGSGKTTLLRAILGLVRVEGRVTVDGHDVARSPELALRGLAYVPQIAPPLEAPLREVVHAACALRGTTVEAVSTHMARFGLDLASLASQRFRDLSGGSKQKVLASLAVAAKSRALVCDEPTANLDPVARAVFSDMLGERDPDGILVLCSHRLEEVRSLVTRVVEMREGRVVHDGPVSELTQPDGVFRVEVTLDTADPGILSCMGELKQLGFVPTGQGRMVGHFQQREKVDLVARLLRDHRATLADFSVLPVENTAARGVS